MWRYALAVPDAVSLSFHAINVLIPDSAVVTLTNGTDVFDITPKGLNAHGELWSRIAQGSRVYITATMPAHQKPDFSLPIVSLQAGFKGFGGTGNAKAYDVYAARAVASGCRINYSCVMTPSNSLPSRSVVGILINNTWFCSGTLMNNQRGDYKPYVLTARHCGVPANNGFDASGFTIAWNAVAECGQPLDNVYSASTITSSGATTRMVSAGDAKGNTGDAWLVELNSAPPIGSHPYWAGFDASDNAPAGAVYAIHHANQLKQQHSESTTAPSKFLLGGGLVPTTTDGGSWSVIWTSGSADSGASGSGLVDGTSNRVIGTLTGSSNANNCPGDAAPPFTYSYRLAMSWNGNGLNTGSIKHWLDPDATATTVLNGKIGPPAVELTAPATATAAVPFTVSWTSTDATSCTASGGSVGDGWTTGAVATSGFVQVTEPQATYNYSVTCTNTAGSRSSAANVVVQSASTGGSGGSGSGGGKSGGGALNLMGLLPLLVLGLRRRFAATNQLRGTSHVN